MNAPEIQYIETRCAHCSRKNSFAIVGPVENVPVTCAGCGIPLGNVAELFIPDVPPTQQVGLANKAS